MVWEVGFDEKTYDMGLKIGFEMDPKKERINSLPYR